MTRMFGFITKTWNPLGGECLHNCYGGNCWAKRFAKNTPTLGAIYGGPPRLLANKMTEVFTEKDFVFVASMNDLFGDWVPSDLIQSVIDRVAFISRAKYLFLTKNPKRYLEFDFKGHMTAGATIETNREMVLGDTPRREDRIEAMARFAGHKFLSIEPILDFDLTGFEYAITDKIKPEFVAVGYDNYAIGLPEPPLAKTKLLIEHLRKKNIVVYEKTLREPIGGD